MPEQGLGEVVAGFRRFGEWRWAYSRTTKGATIAAFAPEADEFITEAVGEFGHAPGLSPVGRRRPAAGAARAAEAASAHTASADEAGHLQLGLLGTIDGGYTVDARVELGLGVDELLLAVLHAVEILPERVLLLTGFRHLVTLGVLGHFLEETLRLISHRPGRLRGTTQRGRCGCRRRDRHRAGGGFRAGVARRLLGRVCGKKHLVAPAPLGRPPTAACRAWAC